MLKFYPSHLNLVSRLRQVGGQHLGIMESQILMAAQSRSMPSLNMCTSKMPDYHKILVHPSAVMNYHLSGYGEYFEEALVRNIGESMERYSLLAANNLFSDRIECGSYRTMSAKYRVVPWEYLTLYSTGDYDNLSSRIHIRPLEPDDPISWIPCASLFHPDQAIYVPTQLIFLGQPIHTAQAEPMFLPGFSKGTAAHVSFKKALKSAILEFVEADALMLNWYTQATPEQIRIDVPELLELLNSHFRDLPFELRAYRLRTDDIDVHAVGVALIHEQNQRPLVVFGCQAHLNAEKALYRAAVEAFAIEYLAQNGPLLLPEYYMDTVRPKDFTNLDTNVAYWSDPGNSSSKRRFFESFSQSEVSLSNLQDWSASTDDDELRFLLGQLRQVSEHAVYLDITPPDVSEHGWSVARVYIPELVPMSLPGHPYSQHPRIKRFGGIANELPHPVP